MSEWVSVEKELPKESGKYLVATQVYGISNLVATIAWFAMNRREVDESLHGPGFYNFSDRVGYFSLDKVKYWMPIPEMPTTVPEFRKYRCGDIVVGGDAIN